MIALAIVAFVLFGAGVAIGYGVGFGHGLGEQASHDFDERQQRRHKRCTPEPVRLRLVDYRHPVFFDQDGDAG